MITPGIVPMIQEHSTLGRLPTRWTDSLTLDGTAWPWSAAPALSEYLYRSGSTYRLYVKMGTASATADWMVAWSSTQLTSMLPVKLTDLWRVVSNDVQQPLYNKKLVTQSVPLSQLRKVVSNDVVESLYNNRIITIPVPLESLREIASDDITNIAGSGGILATDTTPDRKS